MILKLKTTDSNVNLNLQQTNFELIFERKGQIKFKQEC